MKKLLLCGGALAAALSLGSSAFAAPITFSGTNGSNLTAEATFAVVGNQLQVTLTNTSSVDVVNTSSLLTAVFFDISGSSLNLSKVSAVLAPGSTVFGDSDGQPAGGVVGGEWAYAGGISGPNGADYGISSTGLNVFGDNQLFPGPDLDAPTSPNGSNYGIVSAGDNPATGNTGLLNDPFIKNSVVFTLGNLPAGFDPALSISNVTFQYGTSFSEPQTPGIPPRTPPAGVPLPGVVWGGLALLGTVAAKRARRRIV